MKLLNKFLIPFAALSLAACSSLDVDDSEAFTENFPEDFDGAVYMELHPQLVSLQVRNYIVNYNADAKDADGLPGDTYKPQAYTITKKKVTAKTVLKIRMARCGGFAISIREVKAGE